MKMKSNMKKFLAVLLAMALVLVPLGDVAKVKAETTEYQNVTLTGVNRAASAPFNDVWQIYLTASGYTGDGWNYKYEGFTYEINGVKGKTGQVSSDGNNLYCTIPTSAVPTDDGTVFKIKAGSYANDTTEGTATTGINILSDLEIAVIGGHLVTPVLEAVSATVNSGDANKIDFTLKGSDGNPLVTGYEDTTWTAFLTPAWCDGTRVGEGDWSSIYSGVFVDGKAISYYNSDGYRYFKNTGDGSFYLDGLNATVGTKVTFKGYFASLNNYAEKTVQGNYFLKEFSFTYDGTNWNFSKSSSETTYTEYTGTPVFHSSDGTSGFYFTGNETNDGTPFPYPADGEAWYAPAYAIQEESSGVFLTRNGVETKTSIYLKKVQVDLWYACISEGNITLEKDDIFTIKGDFIYDNAHKITFSEAKFTYDGSAFKEYTEVVEYGSVKPMFQESQRDGFYFTTGETEFPYDEKNWTVRAYAADDTSGVYLYRDEDDDGTKLDVFLQKIGEDRWFVYMDNDAANKPEEGDEIAIYGNFVYENHVITFEEGDFYFDGVYYYDIDEAPAPVSTYEEFTITDIFYNDISYNESEQCWYLYFTPSVDVPGDINVTYYPNMTYTIGDTTYVSDWVKSNSAYIKTVDGGETTYYNLLIKIPGDVLPQNLEDKYVITLKEGTVRGYTSGTNAPLTTGIHLTEEFTFEVGDKYTASAPAIDYGNTDNTGTNVFDKDNKTTNSLWLTTSDDFPVTSWTFALTKSGDDSGIFVRNETGEYEPTDGTMKRHQSGGYYVENFGTVKTGDIIMLKGTFSMSNLHFITFGTARYQWTGEKWIVYSEIEKEESTEVDGDATSDYKLNSADLVRMIKFMGDKEDNKINLLDADLNATGDIDEYDIQIERKLLLGLTLYEGAPAYSTHDENDEEIEMRLAAFVAPKLTEGFDDYRNAGFTTIIGEQRAVTESTGDDDDETDADEFDAYMNAANDAGLDVLVQSGAITNMINKGEGYSSVVVEEEYEKASAYENFRGFFMADEPNYSNLNMLGTISSDLRALANAEEKKMDLFIAGHPMYTKEEIWDATAGLSEYDAYYRYAENIGKNLGEYTYDFYPFRHKYRNILGYIYDHQDYMEDQWLLNLKVAANASRKSEGAFDTGMVIQSYSEPADGDYLREVGQKEISAQVYAALAYGMKSLNYFTFGEHWDIEKAPTESCMTNNQTIYDAVATVNQEIKNFDHVMLQYNWVGTMGIAGDYSNGNIIKMDADGTDPHVSKRISTWSSTNADDEQENTDTIIGCLKDLNGYDGFMIVNVAVADSSKVIDENISVTFKEKKADGSVLTSTHATVYENGTMKTVQLSDGTFTAKLTPGQGIFVIPYIQ